MQFDDEQNNHPPRTPETADEPEATEEATAPVLPDTDQAEVVEEPAPSQEELAAATDEAETDDAIEHIIKEESDALLNLDDEQAKKAAKPKKTGWRAKLSDFFQAWWYNKWARYGTLAGLVLVFVAVFAVPPSRYFVLNTFGVRATASVTVVDAETDLPLKNALVKLGGAEATTNARGEATLSAVRLGRDTLVVERIAFADYEEPVTVGWGSNPFGTRELTVVGVQYRFTLTDYLSGKPITDAEAVSGRASALADKDGKIVLALEDPEKELIEITITADDYREEKQVLRANETEPIEVKMVPAQPHVYVSKQSGKYDVYQMDVDGKNKKVLLAGTGNENQDIRVVSSPTGSHVAVASIRSSARDSGGYPLRSITVIDVATGASKAIDQAQQFALVDWAGDKLIYQATYAAPSASTNQRQRLISYDAEKEARATLVTTDYFSGFMSSGGYIYYAIAQSDTTQDSAFYRIKPDGSSKQTVLDKPVWGLVRTSVSKLSIETPDGWYTYTLGASGAQKGDSPTNMYASRIYVEREGSEKSLWLDERDGKGVVLVHDKKTDKDDVIVTASGLGAPLTWLSDTVFVYRVQTTNETADYAASINGGEPVKLTDVTAVTGFTTTLY